VKGFRENHLNAVVYNWLNVNCLRVLLEMKELATKTLKSNAFVQKWLYLGICRDVWCDVGRYTNCEKQRLRPNFLKDVCFPKRI
jgi:hypothetical protein